jgi:TolA-binding protein
METIMFTVGVLTMVLVALAALAVYSTVMVLKLKNENNDFQRQMHDVYRVISEREDSLYRNMNDVEQSISGKAHEIEQHIHRTIDNVTREFDAEKNQLHERVDQLNSYVDRRIDKVIDGYLLVKEAEKESKKLIKG